MEVDGEGQKRVIVVAIDGSHYAESAFEFYMDNYSKPKDYLLLLHCQDYRSVLSTPTGPIEAHSLRTAMDEADKLEKELLKKFGDKLKARVVDGQVKTCRGKPGETIVHEANAHNAILIVVGTRGMGRLRRTLLGSVTDYLLHHAHCPVFVNREFDASH